MNLAKMIGYKGKVDRAKKELEKSIVSMITESLSSYVGVPNALETRDQIQRRLNNMQRELITSGTIPHTTFSFSLDKEGEK